MNDRCLVVGTGRAGRSFLRALDSTGWSATAIPARPITDGSVDRAALVERLSAVDLVLLAVDDTAIAAVAAALPLSDAVYAHVSGASGLEVLAPHHRVGSLHPLVSMPDAETGSRRLLDHCTFAVDGDPLLEQVVDALGGRAVHVAPHDRALYHATATIAANHLTALCAQVEQLAGRVGVPVDAYWSLMARTLDNVAAVGPAAALTGPVSRGDWATVRSHLAALPTDTDRERYRTWCTAAAELTGQVLPPDVARH